MGIKLKDLRISGFRGLSNLEIDFENTTVLVGTNNAGKTTIMKALQLALSNTLQITDDDFHFNELEVSDRIIIDLRFISVNKEDEQISEFDKNWATVFTDHRITFDSGGNQNLAFRTIVGENPVRKTFNKKQYIIDEWPEFGDKDNGWWFEQKYENTFSFYFDEIPFFYLDANRDILEDLKSKSSYLGKILSSISYNTEDKKLIEDLVEKLNKETIERSDVLTSLHEVLEELDTAMDNPHNTVDITPFTKKLRDLNKGVKINYSQFSMEYHGMGTRSWSSLLILKAFILHNGILAKKAEVAYYPIVAIEEPESHLHPNAQKKLYSQINDITGQKIIATHSSYIAGSAKIKEVRSVCRTKSEVTIGKLEESLLEPEQIRKINREVINTRGELFFSKLVILFEGETEEQLLPITMEKHFGKSSIELGVNFIGVGGFGNYLPFLRFFKAFNIPFFIFSDNEASVRKEVMSQIRKISPEDQDMVVFLNAGNDIEKELCNNGYIDEVKKAYHTLVLSECHNDQHRASKQKELDSIQDADYYEKIIKQKTKFAPFIAEELCTSKKELPPKMKELYEKVFAVLKPTIE